MSAHDRPPPERLLERDDGFIHAIDCPLPRWLCARDCKNPTIVASDRSTRVLLRMRTRSKGHPTILIYEDRIEWQFLLGRRLQLPFAKVREVRIRSFLGRQVVIESDNGRFIQWVPGGGRTDLLYNVLVAALYSYRRGEDHR